MTDFRLTQIIVGLVSSDVETPVSTTPDDAFRWSTPDQQWIFNLSTKNLTANRTYVYKITLNDTSWIAFQFGTK